MVEKFLEIAKSKIGCGYVYGSQGQIMTQTLLNSLIKTFGKSHYEFTDSQGIVRADKWIDKQAFDCSGFVVWILQQIGVLKANQDYTAAGLYSSLCEPVTKDKLVPGDLVFIRPTNGAINHVGIYSGNDKTIEAIGTRKGVVQEDASRFNVYGRLKVFKNEIEKLTSNKEMTFEQALEIVAEKADTVYQYWLKRKDIDPAFSALIIKIAKSYGGK